MLKINYLTNTKEYLLSVLTEGNESMFVEKLFNILVKFATGYILAKIEPINRQKIQDEHGFETTEDIAIDCIAELFEVRAGYYYQLNDFFKENKVSFNGEVLNLSEAPEELLISKLRSLISCVTGQRLYELNFPYYVKKRKSLYVTVDRNKNFKKFYSEDLLYLHTCSKGEIKLDMEQVTQEILLDYLYQVNLAYPSTPKVLEEIFKFIDSQTIYCKAIDFNLLVKILVNFDEERFKGWIASNPTSTKIRDTKQFYEDFEERFENILTSENKTYQKTLFKKIYYIFSCKPAQVNYEQAQFQIQHLLKELISLQVKNVEIVKLIKALFSMVNTQKQYCKAVEYYILLNTLIKFYLTII